MAIIKKFRIKSYKNQSSIIEFKDISLSYGNRLILDYINFNINEGQILECLDQTVSVNQQYLIY